MTRRLATLVLLLLLAVAVPAAAQTAPARLEVTATSDRCEGGLPVVDYTVTNSWSTATSVEAWWLADASVWGDAGTHDLSASPASASGSFTLPYGFYSTVTVFATATWPDGKVTTNASWAIPVADCNGSTPPTTTPTTIPVPPSTTGPGNDGNGHGNGNGNNGNGHGNE